LLCGRPILETRNELQVGGSVTKLVRSWPAALAVLFLAGAVGAQEPERHPNSQRYRDQGAHPTSNRSGSATLAALALLDGAGSTEITLQPGSSATNLPGGTIPKAQFKAFYDRETETETTSSLLYTRNLKAPQGTSLTVARFDDLGRNQRVQIQANVTGIDPNRTDVVTVDTRVKLRPDPLVQELIGPIDAHLNVPIDIAAVIHEKNGDVGATANCVLYIDGVEVDRAEGVWVDAAGTITCAFTHTFAVAGEHDVRIAIENVTPGDYNTTNNERIGTIRVASPDFRLPNFGYYQVYEYDYYYRNDGGHHNFTYLPGHSQEYSTEQTSRGWQTYLQINANAPFAISLHDGIQATLTETHDGGPSATAVDTLTPDRIWDSGWWVWYYDYEYDEFGNFIGYRVNLVRQQGTYMYLNGAWGQVYVTEYDYGGDGVTEHAQTDAYLYRYTGDAVYYGHDFNTWVYGDGYTDGWSYSWDNGRRDLSAPPTTQTFEYRLDLLADRAYTTGAQTIVLDQRDAWSWGTEWDYGWGDERYGGQNKGEERNSYVNRWGAIWDGTLGQ
jgi:hypothetical protein